MVTPVFGARDNDLGAGGGGIKANGISSYVIRKFRSVARRRRGLGISQPQMANHFRPKIMRADASSVGLWRISYK